LGSEVATVSPTRQALRRVRRDRSSRFGAVLVIALVVVAAAAPLLAKLERQDPYTYNIALLDPARGNAPLGSLGGVSAQHWFGVEPLTGRDLFAIVVLGMRTSLFIGVSITVISTVIGTLMGISAAYFGGWYDAVVSRFLDFLFGFPALIFIVALSIIVPAGFPRWLLLILALSLFSWAGLARLIRNQAMSRRPQQVTPRPRPSGGAGPDRRSLVTRRVGVHRSVATRCFRCDLRTPVLRTAWVASLGPFPSPRA
jgi:peptide/nickel transport system permease protein